MNEAHDDLRQKIAKYQARLKSEDDPDIKQTLEDQIARWQAQLGISPTHTVATVALHDTTMHGQATGVNQGTMTTITTIYQYNSNASPEEQQQQQRALLAYLDGMCSECNALALVPLDPSDAAHRRAMDVSQVYISLLTTAKQERGKREQGREGRIKGDNAEHPLPALETLTATEQPRTMLLGAPGSGKTTFVNHLAAALAAATHEHILTQDNQAISDMLARTLPGWTLGPLIPVRVILRDFAAFASSASSQKAGLLYEFIQHMLDQQGCGAAFPLIQHCLQTGTALLLLDGIDEVVGTAVLTRVAESIAAIAHNRHTPILATCRILDYQAEPLRQLAGFPTYTLAPFTDEQITQFVDLWYGELHASGRRTQSQARDDSASLTQAITARDELRELARLPLLLTVMALVHANRGTLPDARALLYYECIEILLLRWRQRRGEDDLLTQLNLPHFRSTDLLAVMAHLGYMAHDYAERTVADKEEEEGMPRPADLPERDVIGLLAEWFAQYDKARRYDLAQQVVDALAQGNGLLLKRGPQIYAFPHRTFQEFLAGYHLMGLPNMVQHCVQRSPHTHWYEPLLLMVGYQVLASREFDKPLQLVEKLLERSPDERVLAGDLLLQIGRERLASYDPAAVGKNGIWQRTHRALYSQMVQGRAPDVPAVVRARSGMTFGKLCTYDTLDATVPLYDPRLPLAVIGLRGQRTAGWQQALERYWCRIEAGPFWFGDDEKGEELQQANIPYPFFIARYLLTHADFARFIDAGGYEDEQWWTPRGWAYLQPGGHGYWDYEVDNELRITQPRQWNNSRYNSPIQPVVLRWYEAMAYCRWLTAQGHAQGWLPEDEEFRLPTSLEWERAARHTDKRRYPWGDTPPTPEHANYKKTGIGTTSPVGCFPLGAAMCGASDIAGNLDEWTATYDDEDENPQPVPDVKPDDGIRIRGGDFNDRIVQMFCGSRNRFIVGYINFALRVCRLPRSSEQ